MGRGRPAPVGREKPPTRQDVLQGQRRPRRTVHPNFSLPKGQFKPVGALCDLQLARTIKAGDHRQIQLVFAGAEISHHHPARHRRKDKLIRTTAPGQHRASPLGHQQIIPGPPHDCHGATAALQQVIAATAPQLSDSRGRHHADCRQIQRKLRNPRSTARSHIDLQLVAHHHGLQRGDIFQPYPRLMRQALHMYQLPRGQHLQQAEPLIIARRQHQNMIPHRHHLQRRGPAKPGGERIIEMIRQAQPTRTRHLKQAERARARGRHQHPGGAMSLKALQRRRIRHRQAICHGQAVCRLQRPGLTIDPIAVHPLTCGIRHKQQPRLRAGRGGGCQCPRLRHLIMIRAAGATDLVLRTARPIQPPARQLSCAGDAIDHAVTCAERRCRQDPQTAICACWQAGLTLAAQAVTAADLIGQQRAPLAVLLQQLHLATDLCQRKIAGAQPRVLMPVLVLQHGAHAATGQLKQAEPAIATGAGTEIGAGVSLQDFQIPQIRIKTLLPSQNMPLEHQIHAFYSQLDHLGQAVKSRRGTAFSGVQLRQKRGDCLQIEDNG
ncbi:hypothetical protein PH5382_03918 [Phaeobacter sp. CECT 5382]|nr:hypothetical protein PH5382_03918 [Phaeobacter sp. CECT 5382]